MKLLEAWKWFRRLIGLPGYDYKVVLDLNFVTEYRFSVMSLHLKGPLEEWCQNNIGARRWKVVFYDDDSYADQALYPEAHFEFKYARDAVWFKSTWG